LWFVQTAQKHIHLPMMASGFQVALGFADIALALMDLSLGF
jgi:hypothetical protein